MAGNSGGTELPVLRTVGQAFKLTFQNIPYLVRISWAWVLVMTPMLYGYHYLEATYAWNNAEAAGHLVSILSGNANEFLMLLPLSSIAVGWHRVLLKGEHTERGWYLRLDSVVWRYFVTACLIWLAGYMPFAFAMTVFDGSVPDAWWWWWLGFSLVLAVTAIVASTRIWIALPALALDHTDASVATAWATSRSSVWALLCGSALCWLPVLTLFVMVYANGLLVLPDLPKTANLAASQSINDLAIIFLGGMPAVSFLSLAYRHLTAPASA
jgi:hypothetical protein